MPDLNLDVTVIIPAYQAADTIERAIMSVAAQSVLPREVVVVDDGSTDGTDNLARAMSTELGNTSLTVIRQENAGPGAARNKGVLTAKSRILAFLDADDEWLPEHLEASLRHFEAGTADMTCHNEWLVVDGEESLNDSLSRRQENTSAFVAIYRKGCISTSTVLVQKGCVEAGGGFDPDLANGQDVDLWLSILSNPDNRLIAFADPLSRYYVLPGSIDSHTSRRQKFHHRIARRWAARIASTASGGLKSVWFRASAIDYTALRKFIKSGAYTPATACLFLYPVNVILITLAAFRRPAKRPDFLAGERSVGGGVGQAGWRWPTVLALAWMLGIFLMYIWQFEDKLDYIIKAFVGAG